jgi:hypothetical protein
VLALDDLDRFCVGQWHGVTTSKVRVSALEERWHQESEEREDTRGDKPTD